MKLDLYRISSDDDSTLGVMFIDSVFACFFLEDQFREEPKVMHETRIPAGTYELTLVESPRYRDRYQKRFPEMHKGMILLKDVPGFTGILIHTGNDDDDTSGCLLPEMVGHDGTPKKVWKSTDAYKAIYPPIAKTISAGETAAISIVDCDQGDGKFPGELIGDGTSYTGAKLS